MSRYRKVDGRLWADAKFRRLSPLPPSGQSLWLYLLTCPCHMAPPGLFVMGEMAMAEALRWSLEAFREAFAEAFREGMVEADWEARVVWLPNAIRYNFPESPNVVRGWRTYWNEIPECALKEKAYHAVAKELAAKEAFREAFDELKQTLPERLSGRLSGRLRLINSNSNNNSNSSPPTPLWGDRARPKNRTPITDDAFVRFWALYPKKIAKGAAQKAWAKLSPTPELVASILLAVERQKNSDRWREERGRYIPHPAKWLNDRRWEDELASDFLSPPEDLQLAEQSRRLQEQVKAARANAVPPPGSLFSNGHSSEPAQAPASADRNGQGDTLC